MRRACPRKRHAWVSPSCRKCAEIGAQSARSRHTPARSRRVPSLTPSHPGARVNKKRSRASARGRYTTRLTSLPGTTIACRISLPSRCACTRADAFARSTSSSSRLAHGRLHPVAHAAVDLDHQLEGLALQLRLVGDRPRLLPQPLVAERRPQLLGDVRRVRLDQRDRGLGREARARRRRVAPELVDQLHHRGDRRVEDEPAPDVVGHPRDRLVRLARQRPGVAVGPPGASAASCTIRHSRRRKRRDALDALLGPLHVLVGRARRTGCTGGPRRRRTSRPAGRARSRCRATSTSSSRPGAPSPGGTAAGTARGSRPCPARSAP